MVIAICIVITAILFNRFKDLNHVFHTDIFFFVIKIGMYGLLCILTRAYAYQGVRNVYFSENLACFVFL